MSPPGTRRTADSADTHCDVLVVGGGPGGSAAAYWLAEAGWDVVVVEKKHFPREKTCGDGLTPRAVRQLWDMGLADALAGAHEYGGLRSCAFGKTLEMTWPSHPTFPSKGYVITRHDLDQIVAERAAKAGADVRQGCEALEPIFIDGLTAKSHPDDSHPDNSKWGNGASTNGKSGDGRNVSNGSAGTAQSIPVVAGAVVKDKDSGQTSEIRARYVVVADGANSRFGRALGTARDRKFPLGMALRGYYTSDRHDDRYIESHLDLRDASGDLVPGYGWIFPLGDGRVNVGVGLLTVTGRWKGLNTSHLMDAFVEQAPKSWGLSPETSLCAPTGGKLAMGFAVRPLAGPNALVIGDAAGSINPFNGEGISYGYETGRLAAACISKALAGDDRAVGDYPQRLEDAFGSYYRVGRAFVKLISNPKMLHGCVRAGMEIPPMMRGLMRIMANLMRPDAYGAPEMAYRAMAAIGQALPDNRIEPEG